MYVGLFLFMVICSTSNAVDVDSAKDWLDMYQDIAVVLPKKIKILVDLKIVKQLCHLNVSILCPMSLGNMLKFKRQNDRETDEEDKSDSQKEEVSCFSFLFPSPADIP